MTRTEMQEALKINGYYKVSGTCAGHILALTDRAVVMDMRVDDSTFPSVRDVEYLTYGNVFQEIANWNNPIGRAIY